MSLCSERSVGKPLGRQAPALQTEPGTPTLHVRCSSIKRLGPCLQPSQAPHSAPTATLQGGCSSSRVQRRGPREVAYPTHSHTAPPRQRQALKPDGSRVPVLTRAVGSTHTSGITGNRHSFRDRFWLGHPGQGRVKASPTPAAHTQGRLWPDAQGITAPPRCTLASQVVLPCLPWLRSVPWSREDTAGCLNLSSVPPFREGLG